MDGDQDTQITQVVVREGNTSSMKTLGAKTSSSTRPKRIAVTVGEEPSDHEQPESQQAKANAGGVEPRASSHLDPHRKQASHVKASAAKADTKAKKRKVVLSFEDENQ